MVNVISAGPINSSTWDINIGKMIKNKKNFGYHFKNIQNKEKNKIPLNKIGQSKDIASMVVYLSSDFASWITGSSFNIHGGKQKSIWVRWAYSYILIIGLKHLPFFKSLIALLISENLYIFFTIKLKYLFLFLNRS